MEFRERLNERYEQVLGAVVNAYITHAQPVGSRTLVRQYNLGVSPATVRNVMSDLEEMGYLSRWHISSGRIPTDAGYRYYVDTLLDIGLPAVQQRNRIETDFTSGPCELDSTLE